MAREVRCRADAVTPERSSFRKNPTLFDLYLTLNTWYRLWSD